MGWPESEFGRYEVRNAILTANNPDEFFDKHLSSFRHGWMRKAFWTIKNHPEFGWDDGRSYVELPHILSLKDLVDHIEISKTKPSGRYHLWAKPQELYLPDEPGSSHRSLWIKPTGMVIEAYEKVMAPQHSPDLGMGGFELIKWPNRDGYPQKYLFLVSTARMIGSTWLALVTDVDVPVIDPKENMLQNQA